MPSCRTCIGQATSGICFITIEDETGNANLVVFQRPFDKYRKEILQSLLLMVEGKSQREGEVTHVVVQRCHNMFGLLSSLSDTGQADVPMQSLSRADEKDGDVHSNKTQPPKVTQLDMFPSGRNFR